MKIGLLGAPGSGKSAVARGLVRNLSRDMEPWKIVDGYVDRLNQRTGIPFGEVSTFAHNFSVMCDRWVREEEVVSRGYNCITCGTIYETIMYSTFSTAFRGVTEGEMIYDQMFFKVMMEALGGFQQRTYDYDAIFYLPWTAKYATEHEATWGAVINAKLPEALDGFQKYAVPLEGSTKARVARAAQVVRAIRLTYELAKVEQPGVESDPSDGEAEEHRSESVSDVSSEA